MSLPSLCSVVYVLLLLFCCTLAVLGRPLPSHCGLLSDPSVPLPARAESSSASRGCPIPLSSASHPLNGRVALPLLSAFDDCALRSFTVEMAGRLQPERARSNWSELTASALQVQHCPASFIESHAGGAQRLNDTARVDPLGCAAEVWVDGSAERGGDGSAVLPVASLHSALDIVRSLRSTSHPAPGRLCVTIRNGTYYLGANSSSNSSQVGAVALLPVDSHLTLQAAPGESVVLSGGALLSPTWEKHVSLPAGMVYRTKLDASIDVASFNELYVDGRRAVRAKYPNGDPATHLWTSDSRSGYMDDSDGWYWDPVQPSVDVFSSPLRERAVFNTHQWGLQGDASVFSPPRNFWATAHPPHGSTYIRPSMFTSNLTRMANWTNPAATGQVMLFHQFYWSVCALISPTVVHCSARSACPAAVH